jgi:hypothetical protein
MRRIAFDNTLSETSPSDQISARDTADRAARLGGAKALLEQAILHNDESMAKWLRHARMSADGTMWSSGSAARSTAGVDRPVSRSSRRLTEHTFIRCDHLPHAKPTVARLGIRT